MNDEPLLLDHEADGIKELDNKLPRWWVWLFYLSIAFSVIYMMYYHVLRYGRSSSAEYQQEMKEGDRIKMAALTEFETKMASQEPSKDQTVISQGQQIFVKLCSPCHGAQGQGLVGPNLTDEYWIHGSQFGDTLKTIFNGVPEKGMVTWKGVLKPTEILAVGSYIYTLRGTHPPNPKPPENQAAAPAINPSEFE